MEDHYKLSFTAVSLGLSESLVIAETYLSTGDWERTKERVKEKNLLQARVSSSVQRMYQEVEPRLQTLSEGQMHFLVEEANLNEQKQMLWYMICKRYSFIRDFAAEVLFRRVQLLYTDLQEYDYTVFFNEKADWHDELRNLKETTQVKIRTVLFRMLREADFLTTENQIIPCILSPAVVNQIKIDTPWSLTIFPTQINLIKEGEHGTA